MAQRENGFTIIETTLVLAITGLVIAVILAGIGNSLSHQRYTDAVSQALDFFRGQYSSTSNTLNDRPKDEVCTSSGIAASPNATTIGASDCLLLGRIVRSSNGQDVTVNQVIALHDPTDDTGAGTMTDSDLLLASQLRQGNEISTYQPEWGTRLLRPNTTDGAKFSILVVRTPVTGTVRTYTSTSDTVSITDLLNPSISPQDDLKICIDQTGFFGIGVAPMGILFEKYAANTTGVQLISAGDCV